MDEKQVPDETIEAVANYFRRTGWASDVADKADAESMVHTDARKSLEAAMDPKLGDKRLVVLEDVNDFIHDYADKLDDDMRTPDYYAGLHDAAEAAYKHFLSTEVTNGDV